MTADGNKSKKITLHAMSLIVENISVILSILYIYFDTICN